MAKLCFGLYEKRTNYSGTKASHHPLCWVNANVFDYQAKFRKRDTLHLWKYGIR